MSQKFHLMTWNIDWFRDGRRSGAPNKYFDADCSPEIYGAVVRILKQQLAQENALVFLQEMPYKSQSQRGRRHPLYERLLEDFRTDEYDIFVNGERAYYRCTVGIAAKNTFAAAPSYSPRNNRAVAVQAGGCVFMGVHMPTNFRAGDGDDQMWDELIAYAQDAPEKLVIAGDFNVYLGCRDERTAAKYRRLLKYMDNCVPESIITYGATSIDKFLLPKNMAARYTLRPQEQKELSDHKYLCLDISFDA